MKIEARTLFSERHEIDKYGIIVKAFKDRDPQDLKSLARELVENFPATVILFGNEAKGKASLFFSRSENVVWDMGKLMQTACTVIEGRGGGRPQQAQGGGTAADKLETALQGAYRTLSAVLATANQSD